MRKRDKRKGNGDNGRGKAVSKEAEHRGKREKKFIYSKSKKKTKG